MTWPAPDLPIAYTNTTVSFDTHPEAHNDTNTSLNTNFKPELTRVGDELAGTQSVFVGTDPNAAASILSDSLLIDTVTGGISMRPNTGYVLNSNTGTAGRIQRNDINSTAAGYVAVWDGAYNTFFESAPSFTTGTTPVPATDRVLTIPAGKWSRGGYIDVEVNASMFYNSGVTTGYIIPGWRFSGVAAWSSGGRAGSFQVRQGPHITNAYPHGAFRITIPAGTTYIGLTVMVADNGVTAEINACSIYWMEHTY